MCKEQRNNEWVGLFSVGNWKLQGLQVAVGHPLLTGHANWISRKELIVGLQRAMGFGECRNTADSDGSLHKGGVVAVGFNLS